MVTGNEPRATGSNLGNDPGGRWCVALVVGIVLTSGIHGSTLLYSPPFWQDEVEIVDGGRVVLCHGDSDHGITWVEPGRPFRFSYYLGCALQELVYEQSGMGPYGPRFSSLGGAGLAALAIYGWLRSRGTVAPVAALCGLIFLWDPLFTQGYRGARVDAWAMGLFASALWATRSSLLATAPYRLGPIGVAEGLAGILIGAAGMTWISTALLVPLYVHEAIANRASMTQGKGGQLTAVLARLTVTGGVALATVVALLIPVSTTFTDLLGDTGGNVASATSRVNVTGLIRGSISAFPLILPAMAAMRPYRGRWMHWLPLLAAAAIAAASRPYAHRLVYLLPYLVSALADGAMAHGTFPPARTSWSRPFALLALIAFAHAAVSVAYRNVNAFVDRTERSPVLLEEFCAEIDGGSPIHAYIPYELYFAARQRGWWYYHLFDAPLADNKRLLARLGVAIFRQGDTRDPGESFMQDAGFSRELQDVTRDGVPPSPTFTFPWHRLAWGPYVVYRRLDAAAN